MADPFILVTQDAAVRTLTLNRPASLNAFGGTMHADLLAALDAAALDATVRAVVLTGAGRAFCAGQDLADPVLGSDPVPGVAPPDLGALVERWSRIVLRLRSMPAPVVAAVNGVAAGAGANLALACDMVLAARSAGFVQAFSKIGLIPDSGGTWLLPRLVGRARALGLALLGERLSAEDAVRIGLIWQCVDDADLGAAAQALAARLAALPVAALAATRQAFDAAQTLDLPAALAEEARRQAQLGAAADHREGVAAFREKRRASALAAPGSASTSDARPTAALHDVAALTPQQTADAVRERMFAADRASQALGMRVVAMAPGTATLAMTVRDDMLNGLATCHGGFIAALADSAFAFACNSHGSLTVAAGFGIDFVAPCRAGDVLTARCAELAQAGRGGVYDVEVTNQRGECVAVFRGRSHTLRSAPSTRQLLVSDDARAERLVPSRGEVR